MGPAGNIARRWLKAVDIDPERVFWTNVTEVVKYGSDKPTKAEIREGIERLELELAQLPNLHAVILMGAYAAHLAFGGPMARMHAMVGKLFGKHPCIAVYHPSYILRPHAGEFWPQQRTALENDIIANLARVHHLGEAPKLPKWEPVDVLAVKGTIGLDTETENIDSLREHMRFDRKDEPDPRAVRVLLVGMADGRVLFVDERKRTIADVHFARYGAAEPIAHNLPFDAVALKRWDVKWHDSKMLAHLMGERDTSLKSLAHRILGRPMMGYEEAVASDRDFPAYCVQDAQAHQELFETLWKRAPDDIKSLYETVERPLFPIWCRQTMRGAFRLDRAAAMSLIDELESEVEALREELRETLGVDNPNSPKQLQEALGLASTVAPILQKLRVERPELERLLEYRRKAKVTGTYLQPWLDWPFERLGTLWKPTGAWTGRPSSKRLNLQNVPPRLKRLLLPDVGKVLLEADYSQLEVRIAAHVSQDKRMIEVLNRPEPDDDLHAWGAQELERIARMSIDRRLAKVFVFATFYGGDEGAIIQQAARFNVALPPGLLRIAQQTLRKLFPGFAKWASLVKQLDVAPGLFGRRHKPPTLLDVAKREREMVNAPIQGGAVDILKIAMHALERSGLETVHQIHDAVLVSVDERYVDEAIEETQRILESCVKLTVPLKAVVKKW